MLSKHSTKSTRGKESTCKETLFVRSINPKLTIFDRKFKYKKTVDKVLESLSHGQKETATFKQIFWGTLEG